MGWLQHQREPHSLCKRSRRIRTSSLQQQEPHSLCKRSRRIRTSSLQHQREHTACASADRLLIRGGDRIRINVFEVPEYSGDYQLPPGGDLYLPLIGRVEVAGQTQEQAAETVTANMLAS